MKPQLGFRRVGERCKRTGLAKFRKLKDAFKRAEAVDLCHALCRKKADISDFHFDSDLFDGQSALGKFTRLCVTEPNVARRPSISTPPRGL